MLAFFTAKPLELSGTSNTRDLGGYVTVGGAVTRSHSFLRSDELSKIGEEGKEILYQYGVRCVIDLRGHTERKNFPSPFEHYRDVEYVSIPLSDQVNDFQGGFPERMGLMYRGLLDQAGTSIRAVFETILRYPEDCVLFNCTAGKDRTGVIAMLLLKLADLDDDSVVRDYAITEQYSRPWQESCAELERYLHITAPEHVFRAQPENMREALKHLENVYGTAEAYLYRLGMNGAQINSLKRKLLADS